VDNLRVEEASVENRNRDLLANERTFLAYLRTALSFIAFGFVIARFSLFAREVSIVAHVAQPTAHISTIFGVGMAIVGIVVALYGSMRYATTVKAIERNEDAGMPVWAAVTGGVTAAVIGVIVAGALFAFR
jgi:putative membrane protein